MRLALVAILLAGSICGCAGSFEESRTAALAERRAAVTFGTTPPVRDQAHCDGLDHDHRTFVYAAWATGVLGGAAGTVAGVVHGSTDDAQNWRIGLGVSSAALAAAAVTTTKLATDTATEWAATCSQ